MLAIYRQNFDGESRTEFNNTPTDIDIIKHGPVVTIRIVGYVCRPRVLGQHLLNQRYKSRQALLDNAGI